MGAKIVRLGRDVGAKNWKRRQMLVSRAPVARRQRRRIRGVLKRLLTSVRVMPDMRTAGTAWEEALPFLMQTPYVRKAIGLTAVAAALGGLWWATRSDSHKLTMPGPAVHILSHDFSDSFYFEDGPVQEVHTAWFGANVPCNDSVSVRKQRDENGNLRVMVGVFDGHHTPEAAFFAEDHLFALIAMRMETLARDHKALLAAAAGDEKLRARLLARLEEKQSQLKGHAVRRAFEDCDAYYLSRLAVAMVRDRQRPPHVPSGTTALVGLVDGSLLMVANAGRSRAMLVRGDGGSEHRLRVQDLTRDHVPTDPVEFARLRATHANDGDLVVDDKVRGLLSHTRSIGDPDFKHALFARKDRAPSPPYLTAEPDLRLLDLSAIDVSFVVLASDGVWHRMSAANMLTIVGAWMRSKDLPQAGINSAVHVMLDCLQGVVRNRRWMFLYTLIPGERRVLTDDLSCAVIYFRRPWRTAALMPRHHYRDCPEISAAGVRPIGPTPEDMLELESLEALHRDPPAFESFDQMQARQNRIQELRKHIADSAAKIHRASASVSEITVPVPQVAATTNSTAASKRQPQQPQKQQRRPINPVGGLTLALSDEMQATEAALHKLTAELPNSAMWTSFVQSYGPKRWAWGNVAGRNCNSTYEMYRALGILDAKDDIDPNLLQGWRV